MTTGKTIELMMLSQLAGEAFSLAGKRMSNALATQDPHAIEEARLEAVSTYEALLDRTIFNSKYFYEEARRLGRKDPA